MYFPAFSLENKLFGIHQASFLPVETLEFSELFSEQFLEILSEPAGSGPIPKNQIYQISGVRTEENLLNSVFCSFFFSDSEVKWQHTQLFTQGRTFPLRTSSLAKCSPTASGGNGRAILGPIWAAMVPQIPKSYGQSCLELSAQNRASPFRGDFSLEYRRNSAVGISFGRCHRRQDCHSVAIFDCKETAYHWGLKSRFLLRVAKLPPQPQGIFPDCNYDARLGYIRWRKSRF